MSQVRGQSRKGRGGYVLPAVMMFLALAFGAWVVMFHSSATLIRVEQARMLRQSRAKWSGPAMAAALRLLETGTPPLDHYPCKLTLTQDGVTKYFLLTYEKVTDTRWTVRCEPTNADDPAALAPETFAS